MPTSNADPNTTPTLPAPPGHHSQLIDPPRQTLPTILCLTLAIVLSAFFVALRMYTRRYISRKLWWDDCTSEVLAHHFVLWALSFLPRDVLDGLDLPGGQRRLNDQGLELRNGYRHMECLNSET